MGEVCIPSSARTVAVFDFDDTLIKGDSMLPFLAYAGGWPMLVLATIKALASYVLRRMHDDTSPDIADRRTFLKNFILHDILAGKLVGRLNPAVAHVKKGIVWNPDMRQALLNHIAQGHKIVIASGALDLYMPALLKEFGDYTLICTEMENLDGVLTGYMRSGNCVRQLKADRVAEYMTAHGPFDESWGYGNYPHDVPMLELVKHRVIVA
jgi:HAD superfamily hydrolase (TIGR01490 family)